MWRGEEVGNTLNTVVILTRYKEVGRRLVM